MGDFKKFGKKGGTWNRGPGGKPGFGGQGGGERQMYKAVCAECGKPCEVPFRPSGERPVYCKDCFAAMDPQDRGPSNNLRTGDLDDRRDSRGPSNFQRRDSAPRQNFTPRPSFAARPSVAFGGGGQGSGEDKRLDDIKIQNATIISKLDKLVNLLVNNQVASLAKPKVDSTTLQETIASATKKAKTSKKKAASKRK